MIDTLLSVEEYLKSDFQPDVDYVDGHLEERHVGEKAHGKIIARLWSLLSAMPGVFAFIETRTNVKAGRYRVPDVCVFLDREPDEQIFTTPPYLCIEVLSPEDRLPRMLKVVKDYHGMGVRHVWIVDPAGEVFICDSGQDFQIAPEAFGTPDNRVALSRRQIFGAI